MKIFETQIQIPFKLINDIKEYDKFNPSILNVDLDYNEKIISDEALIYLNNIILKNKNFTNENYKKINEIMNYFHDYEINNYICIIINKKTYNPYIYEETLNNYKDKNVIIISDDCNWCNNYIPFIYNPFFINKKEKPLNYLLMISFFNFIIASKNDNYSLMISLLNKNPKKIINFL